MKTYRIEIRISRMDGSSESPFPTTLAFKEQDIQARGDLPIEVAKSIAVFSCHQAETEIRHRATKG